MRSKTLIVLFVLIFLISGVVAASGDDKKDDKKLDNKAIDDNNKGDKKDDKKIDENDDDKSTGHAKTEENNRGDADTSNKRTVISAQAVTVSEALKGLSITDLQIHVPQDVIVAKKIQVKAYYANGTLKFTRNFFNKAAANGIILLQFDDLSRGERVDVRLQTDQYGWLESTTMVILRPDLTVSSAIVAEKIIVGGTLTVNVTVQEINGDIGAGAVVSLMDGVTVLDSKNVNVNAGSMTGVILSTIVKSGGQYNLSVKITNAVPVEYDETNNIYNLVVSAVSSDLTVSGVNAPAQVVAGERFEALATISELSGNTGANAVVALLENGTVLDSRNVAVSAGGSGIVSLSTIFGTRGEHTLNVRISNAVPVENNEANNIYPLAVRVLSPDLTVTSVSAPVNATVGEKFEALATISELSGTTGANATIVLFENGTVLDSRNVAVPAGGSGIVSLSTIFGTRGEHTLSVRITSTVPADYNDTNNIYSPLVVRAVSPDLAVANVNAPANAAIGQGFEVLATISELYGETGANATVALVENSIVLDSRILSVPAGGSYIVSLNGSLTTAGSHNITVRITGSVPLDSFPGNNEQTVVIRAVKPPEPMSFSSKYYYQNTSIIRSRYILDSDNEEKGEELELREDEVVSFTAVSNRSLTFPFRVNISIVNETGEGNTFKETGVIPTTVEGSRRIFTKHYNESETTLTIGVDETGISMNIEGKANSSIKRSSGYKQWWFGNRYDWNVITNSSSGKLIRARETLKVRIELEDNSHFLGGNAVTTLGNKSYTNGWVNNDNGRLEEQTTVWIYSGEASGDTVI